MKILYKHLSIIKSRNTREKLVPPLGNPGSATEIYQVQAQNQLRIKCIQAKITKPTQNQVYSSQNHKTNSESSVFKPKSASHTGDNKKMISKSIPQPWMHWQNNNKHSFKNFK